MNQVSTVGLDLAKYIFQLHGADSAGAVVFRKKLRRGQLLAFLATLPPCTVAMEACGSAHYWGREIAKLGHTVKLIAPAYVKPFVKRQKNDMADAEAISEAARWPAGPRARAFRLARGWGACSPASRPCWCGWRWPTRWPAWSGPFSPKVGSIELRSRRPSRRHGREAAEGVEGQRKGMALRSRDGSGKPVCNTVPRVRGFDL